MKFDPSTSHESAAAFIHENAGAYALGALSPEEAATIDRAIAAFPDLAPEVASAVAVADVLPWSMPLIDPPDLATKLRLFDRIAAEQAPQPEKLELGNRLVAALNTPPAEAAVPTLAPAAARPWHQYLTNALVAPLALALVVVSVWAYNLNDDLEDLQNQPADQQEAMLLAAEMQMYAMENGGGASSAGGSIGSLPNETEAVLMAWDLDPNQDHEVWCEEKDGKKWKVSSLQVGDDGNVMQTIDLPKPIDGYARIYIAGAEGGVDETPELILNVPEKKSEDDYESATPTG